MMFGLAPSPAWLFVGIMFTSLGSVANPAIRSMISRALPPDQQGRVAGALSSIEGLTAIAAPLTGAFVFDLFSRDVPWRLPGAPFVMVSAMLLGAAWLILTSAPRKTEDRTKE
jgi:DHA1 family tetracycline resistance protein-like MFS transporter